MFRVACFTGAKIKLKEPRKHEGPSKAEREGGKKWVVRPQTIIGWKYVGQKVNRRYRCQPPLPIYTVRIFCPGGRVLNITSAEVLPPRAVFYPRSWLTDEGNAAGKTEKERERNHRAHFQQLQTSAAPAAARSLSPSLFVSPLVPSAKRRATRSFLPLPFFVSSRG